DEWTNKRISKPIAERSTMVPSTPEKISGETLYGDHSECYPPNRKNWPRRELRSRRSSWDAGHRLLNTSERKLPTVAPARPPHPLRTSCRCAQGRLPRVRSGGRPLSFC